MSRDSNCKRISRSSRGDAELITTKDPKNTKGVNDAFSSITFVSFMPFVVHFFKESIALRLSASA